MVSRPTFFDVQMGTVQEKFKMKLVELQCSDELRFFLGRRSITTTFYKDYLECKK